MPRYNEITTRHKMIGNREFNTGSIVRVVSISERESATLNEMSKDHGFKYELEEVKTSEPTEKEIRAKLFQEAAEKGLNPAKNIKTEDLKALVNAN